MKHTPRVDMMDKMQNVENVLICASGTVSEEDQFIDFFTILLSTID